MNLLNQLRHALHRLPWQEHETDEAPSGSFVVAVALASVAAAMVLVLAP